MAENKTKPNQASVAKFLSGIDDEQQRKNAKTLDKMFREISAEKPVMWGSSIIGYGDYHYKYDSGREGNSIRIGFSSRKQNLVIYIVPGFDEYSILLKKLGKYKTGKSCLYIKRLEDIDMDILRKLSKLTWNYMKKRYPLDSKG